MDKPINITFPQFLIKNMSISVFFKTIIQLNKNLKEVRNSLSSVPLRQYFINPCSLSEEDNLNLLAFFNACKGKMHSFKFNDETNNTVSNIANVDNDGVFANLNSIYQSFHYGGITTTKHIKYPIAKSIKVFCDNELIPDSDIKIYANGNIAVTNSKCKTVKYEINFLTSVRFNQDTLSLNKNPSEKPTIETIELIETNE